MLQRHTHKLATSIMIASEPNNHIQRHTRAPTHTHTLTHTHTYTHTHTHTHCRKQTHPNKQMSKSSFSELIKIEPLC